VIEGEGIAKTVMECSKVAEHARREGIGFPGSGYEPNERGVKKVQLCE